VWCRIGPQFPPGSAKPWRPPRAAESCPAYPRCGRGVGRDVAHVIASPIFTATFVRSSPQMGPLAILAPCHFSTVQSNVRLVLRCGKSLAHHLFVRIDRQPCCLGFALIVNGSDRSPTYCAWGCFRCF
jgi:hypothetical protein